MVRRRQCRRTSSSSNSSPTNLISNAIALPVFRGFEEGVFLWAADHLVEGGAGSDHRVDAVFFFYGEVDEEGFAAGAGFGGCWCDLGAFGDVGCVDAMRGGEHDEVG